MKLKAQSREIVGKKVSQLRSAGSVPASIYGPNRPSVNVAVSPLEFRNLFTAMGYSNLFDLELDGKISKVLIKEVQQDVLTDEVLHVSFYEVDMSRTITTEIPITITGESLAVKNNLGLLINPVNEIMVSCLPGDLPAELVVSISGLNEVGSSLHLSDITLPANVEFAPGIVPSTSIAYIAAPQKAVEATEDEAEVADTEVVAEAPEEE